MMASTGGDDKKFQIRATQEDQSRLKSLEFLLLAVGRQITSEQLKTKEKQDVQEIRDTLKTLKVTEDGENWMITTKDSKVTVNKTLFSFYRRDSSTTVPIQNNNALNARKVLQELLSLQIESNSVSRKEKYPVLSQPQLLSRIYSYFLLILFFLAEIFDSMLVKNTLVVYWFVYVVIFLLAGFLKRRQNIILFSICASGSIVPLVMSSFTASKMSFTFLNQTSLYISTILFIALNLIPTKTEFRKLGKDSLLEKKVLVHLFCVMGVVYLAINNSELILKELFEILLIISPLVVVKLFDKIEKRVFSSLFRYIILSIPTIFLLSRLEFEPLRQVVLFLLILISTQLYEFFHGTRLNYFNFFGRNAILLAGVIV
jgi:hypothetical protein